MKKKHAWHLPHCFSILTSVYFRLLENSLLWLSREAQCSIQCAGNRIFRYVLGIIEHHYVICKWAGQLVTSSTITFRDPGLQGSASKVTVASSSCSAAKRWTWSIQVPSCKEPSLEVPIPTMFTFSWLELKPHSHNYS